MWRKVGAWPITVALTRKAIEWWACPKTGRLVIKSRSGSSYDFRITPLGSYIRKRNPIHQLKKQTLSQGRHPITRKTVTNNQYDSSTTTIVSAVVGKEADAHTS